MIKPEAPCHGCEERSEDCHTKCKEYLQFKEKLEAYNEWLKDKKNGNCPLARIHFWY